MALQYPAIFALTAIALCLPLGAHASDGAADETAATVTSVQGAALSGGAEDRTLVLRSAIRADEPIATRASSTLSMLLADSDAVVDLCADTRLALQRASGGPARIAALERGTLQAFVEARESEARLEIRTPGAVAVVLGTAVQVSFDPSTGTTTVIGRADPVRVSSTAAGAERETTVCCGQAVDIEQGAAPGRARRVRESELSALQTCREDLHRAAARSDRSTAAPTALDRISEAERPALRSAAHALETPGGRGVEPESPCYTENCLVAAPALAARGPGDGSPSTGASPDPVSPSPVIGATPPPPEFNGPPAVVPPGTAPSTPDVPLDDLPPPPGDPENPPIEVTDQPLPAAATPAGSAPDSLKVVPADAAPLNQNGDTR